MYEKIYLVKMGPIFVGSAFVSSTFLGIRDGKAVTVCILLKTKNHPFGNH